MVQKCVIGRREIKRNPLNGGSVLFVVITEKEKEFSWELIGKYRK